MSGLDEWEKEQWCPKINNDIWMFGGLNDTNTHWFTGGLDVRGGWMRQIRYDSCGQDNKRCFNIQNGTPLVIQSPQVPWLILCWFFWLWFAGLRLCVKLPEGGGLYSQEVQTPRHQRHLATFFGCTSAVKYHEGTGCWSADSLMLEINCFCVEQLSRLYVYNR